MLKKQRNMKRKVFFLSFFLLCTTLMVHAQSEILQKYTEMGDINTTFITKNRLASLPLDQLNVPGMESMLDKIESLTLLVSKGDKAGKKLGTKLPGQLSSHGYDTKLSTVQDGQRITIMQSRKDPQSVVVILYKKPQATVVSMRGDFSDATVGER